MIKNGCTFLELRHLNFFKLGYENVHDFSLILQTDTNFTMFFSGNIFCDMLLLYNSKPSILENKKILRTVIKTKK